jgi:peptide/nickel transport system permease protein
MNIRLWLQSRTVRRFLHNRLAVASSLVVLAYVLIAVAVIFGLITLDDTEARVGAGSIPALYQPQPPEKRLEDAEFWLDEAAKALKQRNVQLALEELRFGAISVADKPVSELESLVDRGREIDNALIEYDDLNDAPEALPKIDELEQVVAELFPSPTGFASVQRFIETCLGTDRQGRSISLRAVYSIRVAIQVGLITALVAVIVGSLLGGAAGFFGGWVDALVIWLYTTFSSIPYLVLLVLIAYMFIGTWADGTLIPVYVAFGATFWISPCRVIRGETLKIKELEYVQAATAIGFSRAYTMVRHILPNTAHLMLISFSLVFISAIKAEVILTFLGLGVKKGPSWGIMITQSGAEVVNGYFSQITTATVFMFGLVLAVNIFSDAMQDILDPKAQ